MSETVVVETQPRARRAIAAVGYAAFLAVRLFIAQLSGSYLILILAVFVAPYCIPYIANKHPAMSRIYFILTSFCLVLIMLLVTTLQVDLEKGKRRTFSKEIIEQSRTQDNS